jgi:predicted RNA-binding Zn ribbon-like protein
MDELADRFPPPVGGALCLDFANTVDPRSDPATDRDHLRGDYRQLIAWAEHAGLVRAREAARLRRQARASPEVAARVLEDAVRLREAIFAVFAAVAAGRPPATDDLGTLRDGYAAAVKAAALVPGPDGMRWSWPAGRDDAEASLWRPVWPVAASAARLVTSPDRLPRVKLCDGERCNWLFLDTSRNRSRRWCLMRYCGNVGKSRRQAARRRATRAQAARNP